MVENSKKIQTWKQDALFKDYTNICYIVMLETVTCNVLWPVQPSAQLT